MKNKKMLIVFVIIFIIVFCVAFVLCFPKRYEKEIRYFANKYNLSEVVVYSVINIESGFNPKSTSTAGAIGLMQLLPTTAEDCANRLDIPYQKDKLLEVNYNLELGCFYLSYLLDIFDDNMDNVLAAYNWGLGNVKDWIAIGNANGNGSIINIPTKETKEYLEKFKVNKFIYQKIYRIES